MSTKLHPSAFNGFSQAAQLYQQSRPSYPDDIVAWLQHDLLLNQKSKVVDLGAGTGKFIPYLKQVTPFIFAIEPISEMLEQLTQQHPDIHTIQTDSKNLTLPSHSMDAVLCAQSFHWFADSASLDEIYHILKPHGVLGLIWNQRDISVDWVKAIADLLAPFEDNTPRFHHGTWQHIFETSHQFQLQSTKKFVMHHSGTVEQVVINRILSTSFIAASSTAQQYKIKQQLSDIMVQYLGKYPEDIIDFPYVTYAYHYQKCE